VAWRGSPSPHSSQVFAARVGTGLTRTRSKRQRASLPASACAACAARVGQRDVGASPCDGRWRSTRSRHGARARSRLSCSRGATAARRRDPARGSVATITVSRSRAEQCWRERGGSARPASRMTASALAAPVASSRQLRAAREHGEAQRDPLGGRLGRVVHAQADRVLAWQRGRGRRGNSEATWPSGGRCRG